MAYGLKYRFKFENIHGVTYEVDLLEDGFSGTVRNRPLGSSPVLRMQTSGPFRSTCCELTLECKVDTNGVGEFASLYTSDPLQYMVKVYHGSMLIWEGFVATELYSEPDIAPPYDVRITATDGLGVLKEYDFEPAGPQTIRKHLKTFLAQTGLELGIYSIFSVHEHGDTVANFLDNVLIDLDYHKGESVYDALSDLLTTLRCTITQWFGDWLLIRDNDITVNGSGNVPGHFSIFADTASTYDLNISYLTATVGKMGVADMWPVGYLTRRIAPAKKSVTVRAPWHWKNGFPQVSENAWTVSGNGSFISSGKYYKLGQPAASTALVSGTLAASATILRFMENFKVTVKANAQYPDLTMSGVPGGKVQILAACTNLTTGTVYYYSPQNGWTTTSVDGELQEIRAANPEKDINATQEVSFEFPAIGIDSPCWFTVNVKGYIVEVYDVSVEPATAGGYEDNIIINNGARGAGETVTISGGRVTTSNYIHVDFMQGAFYEITTEHGAPGIKPLTSFDDNDNSQRDYMSLTALNCAKVVAEPRVEITGKIDFPYGMIQQPLIIKSHGVWALMESYDWDLKEAEINFKAVTLPTATLSVASEEITSLPNN